MDSVVDHWMELRLMVPEADPLVLEALDAEILAITPGGFAIEAWDAPTSERGPVPVGWSRYLVYVGEAQAEDARARLGHAARAWPSATVEVAHLPEGWRDRWKRYFTPIDVSPRLVVAPPWDVPPPVAGKIVLLVEPGMAFGTAQHETTALCLAGIDALYVAARPATVFDMGCGTGILGIAAAALGAREVLGTDIDPNAILAALENERLNAAPLAAAGHPRCRWETTAVGDVAGAFDLVLANILTPTLLLLAAPIARRVRAGGGRLMLSGILAEHAEDIIAAFTAEGLDNLGVAARNGWIRVDFERP